MRDALTASVEAIMREAAESAILPHYQRLSADEITAKAADDVVSVADFSSERLLTEKLGNLLPEALIVGEEAAHADPSIEQRLSPDLCWIIDPLDGTNNFAAGHAPFGILVALAEKGETIAGWIFDPLKNRFCHAQKGQGAFINHQRVQAQSSGETPPIAAISLLFASPDKRAALLKHIAPAYQLVDIPRCAAEQYPRLVLGENDATIFERTLAWDHAAGALFTNEAGGCVARPDGRPYRVDEQHQAGLLGASSPNLWETLARQMERLTLREL